MSIKYVVKIEDFAWSHYLKKISKKYKASFDLGLLDTICKTEFKIMPNESTKSSGNRCILVQDSLKQEIRILLVYHKGDIQGGNETEWWKKMISGNYKEFKNI